MRGILLLLVATALAVPALGPLAIATTGPASAGNGYIMMVHGEFRPWVNEVTPEGAPYLPPVPEAAMGMSEEGQFIFRAIVYSVETGKPVVVADPVLHVWSNLQVQDLEPNVDPATDAVCVEETSVPGYEGPVAACNAFGVPADSMTGRNVVTLRLSFTDAAGPQVEVYNVVAHGLLHDSHQSGHGREEADYMGDPTPFLVGNVVEATPAPAPA